MVFSSIPFLYYFLPITLLLYFLVPAKAKNAVLFFASLVFYAWGEPGYVFLMLFSILLGYISGLFMEKSMEKQSRFFTPKKILTGTLILFVGIFVFFKYTNFFIKNVNAFAGTDISLLKLALPIGISFYTFQMISYLVDVYRKEVPAQKNFISLGAYITMFPQLIAGPIVRYESVAAQLKERSYGWEKIESGITRFIVGLAKKVLIANELGALCDIFRASGEKSLLFYWMYAFAFALHIYFDFSGYSDMAIGLGKILGFTFPENFNYPYISKSITEFWRRWHMSLGSWFRDYVYIPLGGNRVSTLKWVRNILVVWMLTGFWHGAEWNFLLWGLYFGVLLLIEKKWLNARFEKLGKGFGWLRHIYVIILLVFSFVLFNAASLPQAYEDFKCLLGLGGLPITSAETLYYLRSYGMTLLVAIIGATPVVKMMAGKNNVLKSIVLIGFLLLSTAYLVDGSFNPFLYFRF